MKSQLIRASLFDFCCVGRTGAGGSLGPTRQLNWSQNGAAVHSRQQTQTEASLQGTHFSAQRWGCPCPSTPTYQEAKRQRN